jgi:hypothetical protein
MFVGAAAANTFRAVRTAFNGSIACSAMRRSSRLVLDRSRLREGRGWRRCAVHHPAPRRCPPGDHICFESLAGAPIRFISRDGDVYRGQLVLLLIDVHPVDRVVVVEQVIGQSALARPPTVATIRKRPGFGHPPFNQVDGIPPPCHVAAGGRLWFDLGRAVAIDPALMRFSI